MNISTLSAEISSLFSQSDAAWERADRGETSYEAFGAYLSLEAMSLQKTLFSMQRARRINLRQRLGR